MSLASTALRTGDRLFIPSLLATSFVLVVMREGALDGQDDIFEVQVCVKLCVNGAVVERRRSVGRWICLKRVISS